MEPTYQADQLRLAYQLNWSLSVFAKAQLPDRRPWIEQLTCATEADGVRVLEHHQKTATTHQFLLSTRPSIRPSDVVRSVKGRLQYAVRNELPRALRRNYCLESVGEANNATLQQYVAKQTSRHPMADERVQRMLESLQFVDPTIDLTTMQRGGHCQYLANLHLVFENRGRLPDIREDALRRTREAIIRTSIKHGWRLSRIGLVSNHLHLLLGCGLVQKPLSVGMSFMNNIAYVHGMRRVLDDSFYVGTFGTYNRDAIRRFFPEPTRAP